MTHLKTVFLHQKNRHTRLKWWLTKQFERIPRGKYKKCNKFVPTETRNIPVFLERSKARQETLPWLFANETEFFDPLSPRPVVPWPKAFGKSMSSTIKGLEVRIWNFLIVFHMIMRSSLNYTPTQKPNILYLHKRQLQNCDLLTNPLRNRWQMKNWRGERKEKQDSFTCCNVLNRLQKTETRPKT